ncbi:AsmA family protein [Mesorhizobium sp. YIM 152430]|uniref:AsmA family protein n=1 Tax=Mesorhizobium sp. YIM 152430 TaxID=3031761 RepID=UPI0023D9F410|nr:AsmA family protein [Mesorhizobium sp. YIM 152430]MDF1598336.1 AsmA family protein [Mesorhizobium sp. YIM 152430]
MLARLFVIIGGLIVLALSVALVGPFFVDWTSYRADFEREASRILGRDVTVDGEASARLLPFPSVTFANVSVAGGPGGEPAMQVETFSMDAELAPFLRGEILIFDMRLVRPIVTVELDESGSLDWIERPGGDAVRQITFENISVEDGEVRLFHRKSERLHRVSNLDARISAQTLAGPWRLEGTGAVDGVQTSIGLSTGTFDNGAIRVRLRASPFGSPFLVETDGSARISDGKAVYSGQFRAEMVDNQPENQPSAAVSAHRVTGNFDIDHDALDIPEFTYQTGPVENPYIASGRGGLDFGADPRFFIAADGAQIRLDEGTEPGTASLETRLAGIERLFAALPKPAIPGTVEVNLPALVAGDTTIRDLTLNAQPSETGWRINNLRALLPGRSTIEASGDLVAANGLEFQGELLVAVNQPSGFASWLARDVDEAIRRLPPGGFSAEVALSRERQSFRDLELALGGAVFRGEIDSATPPDMRPSLRIALDGDRLDLPAMRAFASLFISQSGTARLEDRDVDIDLKAGPVMLDGLEAGTLDTAVRLRDGQIEVDRLAVGDLAGANVSATASLHGLGATPTGHVDASVIAVDLAPLVDALAGRFPDNQALAELSARARAYPGLFENAALDFVASAVEGEGGAVSANGSIGGTALQLTLTSPRTDLPVADLPIGLNLSMRNDEPAALYALAGLPGLPLGFVGPAEATARVAGALSRGAETSLGLRGDGLDASFDGTLRLDGSKARVQGSMTLDTDDLSGWLATAGVSLPGMTAGLPFDIRAGVDAEDGLVVLSGIAGTALDQVLSGDLNIDMRNGRPHLAGALDMPEINLGWLASLVVGEAALEDGSVPFNAAASDLFSANVDLTAGRAEIGPESLTDMSAEMRFGPEGLRLNGLSGRIAGGGLRGFAELANNSGTALFQAQLALTGGALSDLLNQPALDGAFDLSAVASSNGRTFDTMMSSLSGTVSLDVPEVAIRGLDGSAFPGLLAAADRIGRDLDEDATQRFAPEIIGRGVFEARAGEIALSMAGGQLRAPPIRLDGEGADVSADVRADLSRGSISVDALVSYDAGDEQLVGSTPAVRILVDGPPSDPDIRFDTQPLAQFLTQRALEIEQARVEALQASLLEAQRLRRENRYFAAQEQARLQRLEERRREEAEIFLREEAARIAREAAEEEQRRAEEAERAAEEAARLAEEEAARRAEQAERIRQAAEEAARQREQETNDAGAFQLDVERFLQQEGAFEPESSLPTPLPAPAPPAGAEIFRPENLTIDGLLGRDGLY